MSIDINPIRSRGTVQLSLVAALAMLPLAALAGPDDVSAHRAQKATFYAAGGLDPQMVKNRKGAPPRPQLVTPMRQVVVHLKAGVNPDLFAAYYGIRLSGTSHAMANTFSFDTSTADGATRLIAVLKSDTAVASAYQNAFVHLERRAFVPNDPLYTFNNPSGFPGQWHLRNTNNFGGANIDVKVWDLWQADVTGAGVTIGIVDDSTDPTHPDLSANYKAADSWDFGQNDSNPSPVYSDDMHGIAVSGVAAARGGNGIGVTGVAPFAGIAGLRCDFNVGTAQMFADANTYHSSGGNTSIQIKNHSYGFGDVWIQNPSETAAQATSTAAGTIHVRAAGNARGSRIEDAVKEDVASDSNSLVIAALGSDGKFADYSSYGANVFITAPSSSDGQGGITTTDRVGSGGYNGFGGSILDYTPNFGGTSSASPLVAGIMALGKASQPALTTRMVKHLLALTSDVVDASDSSFSSDGGWKTNAAGYKFNLNYGFGRINATKFVQQATQYTGVSPLVTTTVPTTTVNAAIPDGVTNGTPGSVSRTFTVSGATKPLEDVSMTLALAHSWMGDVEVYLTSPSGTKRRLMARAGSDNSNYLSTAPLVWTFVSNAYWGESANGVWTIEVQDRFTLDTGTFVSYSAKLNQGELVASAPALGAQFISQSVPSTMASGTSYPVTITMKNTGTETWTRSGHYLYSQNPNGNSNFGLNTILLPTGVTVPAGGSYTFSTTVTPNAVGIVNFQWQMKKSGGVGLFGDVTTNVPVTVTGSPNAQFVTQTVPNAMITGAAYNVSLTFKNNGGEVWNRSGHYLYSALSDGNSNWGSNVVKLPTGVTVPIGANYTFDFPITAPLISKAYNFAWRMKRSGVGSFGQASTTVVVDVTGTSDSTFTSQSVPTTMVKGSTHTVTLTFKNTGQDSWTRSKHYLYAINPNGNSRWGANVVKLPSGTNVKPGSSLTITFDAVAPATPGTYNFQWTMRKSSVGSFGQPSTNVVVTVTN